MAFYRGITPVLCYAWLHAKVTILAVFARARRMLQLLDRITRIAKNRAQAALNVSESDSNSTSRFDDSEQK